MMNPYPVFKIIKEIPLNTLNSQEGKKINKKNLQGTVCQGFYTVFTFSHDAKIPIRDFLSLVTFPYG